MLEGNVSVLETEYGKVVRQKLFISGVELFTEVSYTNCIYIVGSLPDYHPLTQKMLKRMEKHCIFD